MNRFAAYQPYIDGKARACVDLFGWPEDFAYRFAFECAHKDVDRPMDVFWSLVDNEVWDRIPHVPRGWERPSQ